MPARRPVLLPPAASTAAVAAATLSRIAGSGDKLKQVLAGFDAVAVHNAGIAPGYPVKTVEQVAGFLLRLRT